MRELTLPEMHATAAAYSIGFVEETYFLFLLTLPLTVPTAGLIGIEILAGETLGLAFTKSAVFALSNVAAYGLAYVGANAYYS